MLYPSNRERRRNTSTFVTAFPVFRFDYTTACPSRSKLVALSSRCFSFLHRIPSSNCSTFKRSTKFRSRRIKSLQRIGLKRIIERSNGIGKVISFGPIFRATEKFFATRQSLLKTRLNRFDEGEEREREKIISRLRVSFHPVEGNSIGSARENIYQPPLNMQLPFENSRSNG